MKSVILFALGGLLSGGVLLAQSPNSYQQEIADWHAKRIQGLKAPSGWLNLVGLYWLDEGMNSFGASPDNKIVFPNGTIADVAGTFERSGNKVTLRATKGAGITIDDKPVTEAVVYDPDSTRQPTVAAGRLRWTIIKRDDKLGIRLRDLQSPLVTQFKDVDRYPVDTAWRVPAILRKTNVPNQIAITNVLGQTSKQETPGKLVFVLNNKEYTLDALQEGSDLFIVFGDATSGKTTYPAGRFLAVKKPGADGTTIIDFNKAYNPPCAFTDYATCPLPPPQNILPTEITAGEKDYGKHGGK